MRTVSWNVDGARDHRQTGPSHGWRGGATEAPIREIRPSGSVRGLERMEGAGWVLVRRGRIELISLSRR